MTENESKDLLSKILSRIKDGYCQVLGAGVSNIPLVRWLASKGADITVRDIKSKESIPFADELVDLGAKLICGENYLSGLSKSDKLSKTLIFRSPGLRPDASEIAEAVENGAILTSEMELFLMLTPAHIVAITGSDGKTTTTTLTGKILESTGKGRVFVGGNIGNPLLPEVDNMTKDDFAVVELSSFQLQTMNRSCTTAAITNITENHLNWHRGMEEYTLAKYNIFRHGECKRLVINADNEGTLAAGKLAKESDAPPRLVYFSLEGNAPENADEVIFLDGNDIVWCDGETKKILLNASAVKLPGRHNIANYMTAVGLCLEYLDNMSGVENIARDFGGVEHRLELVRVHNGVKYYNSSIDSTPARTAAALSALKEDPIVICGGSDKGVDFVPLAETLVNRAKAVVLTGACRDKIMTAINNFNGYSPEKLTVVICPDFSDAVAAASELAEVGDTVLLSPACASFDAFKNFEERGNTFKKIINNLK